ncbi:putative bifunctional diguanylate cyclase/phosphodiesterase [Photobacterium alginatilyticum]|uniref:putative bifunctional diguanylate cyclase/phosphodiesterase n=1 Tax=Photobacterium alginatilyticum TaxID=1775171 RepID=UPI0040695B8F
MRLHWRVSLITAVILIALVITLQQSTLWMVDRYVGQSMEQQFKRIGSQLYNAHTIQTLQMLDFTRGSLRQPVYTLDIDLIAELVHALKSQEDVLEVMIFDAELSVLHDGDFESLGQPLASALVRLMAYPRLSQEYSQAELASMVRKRLSQSQSSESYMLLRVGNLQLFQVPIVLNSEVLGWLLLLADFEAVEQLVQVTHQDTTSAFVKGKQAGSLLATKLSIIWIIISLLVLVYILIRVTAPLRLLAAEMPKVARRKARSKLNIQRNDEIGELATAFTNMVNELKKTTVSRDEYRRLSNQDYLTGLANRRYFELRVDGYLKSKLSEDELAAVVSIDLDDFKQINDTKGHVIGDEMLKSVARRLKSSVRGGGSDIVARIGGDEFMVFVTGFSDQEQVKRVAEHLLQIVTEHPYQLVDTEVRGYCSVGVAIAPEHGSTYESLSKCADEAMYVAKHSSKNQYQLYNKQLNAKRSRQNQIQLALHEALKNGELYLHYQPQVELRSGKVIGCEALARWQSSALGTISPTEFIPIAESSGMIIQIGRWALEESLRQLSIWRSQGLTELCIAVNLSSRQFTDDGLIPLIDMLLAKYSLPGKCVELEITESMLINDTEKALFTMTQLTTRGIRLAIDDFGTGYSNLSYLSQLSVHRLKIDRSLLPKNRNEQQSITIIKAIIHMGHALGLNVLTEGVETHEQAQFLCELGCDNGQGFYFARPLPGDKFLSFCCQSSPV